MNEFIYVLVQTNHLKNGTTSVCIRGAYKDKDNACIELENIFHKTCDEYHKKELGRFDVFSKSKEYFKLDVSCINPTTICIKCAVRTITIKD